MADIEAEGKPVTAEDVKLIHTRKTGALIMGSVRIGAILAGADPTMLATLTIYGERIGLAFQIVDDILDVKGDEKELGKPVGSDEGKNKMTYPALYGIESSMQRAEALIKEALDSISALGEDADPLRGIADYIIRRTH